MSNHLLTVLVLLTVATGLFLAFNINYEAKIVEAKPKEVYSSKHVDQKTGVTWQITITEVIEL